MYSIGLGWYWYDEYADVAMIYMPFLYVIRHIEDSKRKPINNPQVVSLWVINRSLVKTTLAYLETKHHRLYLKPLFFLPIYLYIQLIFYLNGYQSET